MRHFRGLFGPTQFAVLTALTALGLASASGAHRPTSLVGVEEVGTAPRQATPAPFDPAPTMKITHKFGWQNVGGPSDTSTLFVGHNRVSSSGEAIWNASVAKLLEAAPLDAQFVFYSYADTQEAVDADISAMMTRVGTAIAQIADPTIAGYWSAHVFFLPSNPLLEAGPLKDLLLAWGPLAAEVTATWTGADGQPASLTTVGTTDTGWAKSLADTGPLTLQLARYGNLACDDTAPAEELTGKAALVARGVCTFSVKVNKAAQHGAAASIIYSDGRPILWMGASCGPCPQIPAIMIDTAIGRTLDEQRAAGRDITVTLRPIKLGADNLAVDHRGRLREFGTIPFPFTFDGFTNPDPLQMVAFEAQQYHYEHALDLRLAAEASAHQTVKVPLFEGVWASDPGWTGQQVLTDVNLPDAATMAQFDKLEVELNMACEGNRKGRCPAWDYLVYLYLCDNVQQTNCNTEFGRWITPYWSGGRWVTDLSPMLALIHDGGPKRFGFWTVQKYQLDMTFRLSDTGQATAPRRAKRILSGGGFWKDYNKNHHPMEFMRPDWASNVKLVSLLTGHGGADLANCSEFCNHTHHIAVNGRPEHLRAHPEAGSDYACMNRVLEGVVPNQAGTWVFGRAGWCPGLDVPPWTIDITGELQPGWNELTYKALLNGQDYVAQPIPPATTAPTDARIELTGWVVYYAPKDSTKVTDVPAPYPRIPTQLALPALYTGRSN
jgi:hypothetical protein